jgi:signal transduction histidine kinase
VSQLSLRGQLTRASMLTTLLVLLLCALALLTYERLTYRSAWVSDLRLQADLIAHSSAAALVFNDPKVAQENLQLLKLRPSISAARIFTADGHVFASYAAEPGDSAPDQLDPVLQVDGARFSGPILEVLYPIDRDDERVGTVYLQARHDIWARFGAYAAILGVVMLCGLAVAVIVFGRLQQRVTRPLREMTAVAQTVVEHRAWKLRAPETPYRDIDVLVQAFNAMLDEVQKRTGELEREMAERVHAERELRAADRRKDEFLALLAHELRNPLAPMTTSIALARMPNATPEAREKANAIIERQLRHMVRLIDDLLDVSRVTTGKLSLEKTAVDLSVLLASAVETAQAATGQKGQSLRYAMAERPPIVHGDAARLSQVFSNLLSNACRYTPAGGHIEVTTHVGAASVEVTVADDGIGVEPEMQQKIFELFEQGDKTLERGNVGLGIGLTLVRQLVQLHGGDIRVASDGKDTGARFTVRLPLLANPPPAASEPVAARPTIATGLRVLLADDNVVYATSLADMLRSIGCSVQTVHDGADALKAAAAQPPDVALLDIGMPRLNGYDVARQLRSNPATRGIRLMAVTGWGQSADRQAAADAGFDRHLVKPVNLDALIDALGAPSAAAG